MALLFPAADSWPVSIDYLNNQSADWMRTLSRNAALDSADIVFYNPAGTAMMKDGFYFNFNNQTLFKTFKLSVANPTSAGGIANPGRYTSDEPTLFLPTMFFVYRKNDLALSSSLLSVAGGGGADYKDGVPFFMVLPAAYPALGDLVPYSSSFIGVSMFPSLTINAAYRVLPFLSLSAGGRYIYGYKYYNGKAMFYNSAGPTLTRVAIKASKTAHGFTGIFGIDINPVRDLNIGARYETETYMRWETDQKKMEGVTATGGLAAFADGFKEKRPLPAVLALGVSYDILDMVRASCSFMYYFVKHADPYKDAAGQTKGYDDDYDDGYDIGTSIEYIGLDRWTFSTGYQYSDSGSNRQTNSDTEMILDAHMVCAGVKHLAYDNLSWTLSVNHIYYVPCTIAHPILTREKFEKETWIIALGLEYRIPFNAETSEIE